MLYGAQVTVGSEIDTKEINTVWTECDSLVLNSLVHVTSRLLKVKVFALVPISVSIILTCTNLINLSTY
jgi:hypothetical protein